MPRAILLDEPFGAQDTRTRAAMQRLLVDTWIAHPTTVVFVNKGGLPSMQVPPLAEGQVLDCDVAVVGGGTAGTMAAISAAEHGASVLLLEKAHVRHSGALAMGMDGVNNAVIPGKATPEDYVAEITRANDGIVNQRTIYQTASRGFDMVRRLERYGVKFEKDDAGDYHVRRVHRSGSYVLPMPEGRDIKKVLYRVLRQRQMRERIRIENRVMPVRVLTAGGRATGLAGFNSRTGEFVTVSAGAVILATGACGRLGLPASGYLYGTYENPTNAGDGYAMAYHAGAELSGLECFQVNPLIKDYNGPACAYVANPFGGYQVNNQGERFVDCDYWSGQMMAEVAREISSARGPIYLKLTHLPEETIAALESILHTTERPTRGTFHAGRGHGYRTHDVEMHISEVGLCGGHSSSGVWVDEHARTTVPGLYAAGDVACVPHNYMIGAFVFGDLAGADAARLAAEAGHRSTVSLPQDQVAAAHELIYAPLRRPSGPPQPQVEYKLRRFVNDYVAPPKTAAKLTIAVETFERMRAEIAEMGATTPHELMRCAEVTFIRDCAELAARASLTRTESRWGLYHDRADLPARDDAAWFCHLNVSRSPDGHPQFRTVPVAGYIVPVPEYNQAHAAAATLVTGPLTDLAVADPAITGAPAASAAASPARQPVTAATRSPRIIALLDLAETSPALAQIDPYLTDPDPQVRRAAIAVLTEVAPPGVGPALARAARDPRGTVRHAAVTALQELAEVLPATPDLRDKLLEALTHEDAVVRAATLDVLRQLSLADIPAVKPALADPDHRVRLQAIRALVSLNEPALIATATTDPSREIRVATATALAALASPASAEPLAQLATDKDPLVRSAALKAAAAISCPEPLTTLALSALSDQAWQVREGAAEALSAASPDQAAPALIKASADPHANVRRAVVIALAQWPQHPEAASALKAAQSDSDADVRAYARRGEGS
ncbi:MAG TPA: fumarate reductase/succinate dehydrogenase flavoprotein subunit [Streptosporangiaceae bacterium]|nr:fumarate reductase/succinate dehydrogenase flavoprotein subunit [Streptosporangiaceae bacterium]